jgi:hypothetical protein
VATLAAYAVRAIDAAHQETETSLVTRRVERTLELLRENVVSASVWNDACVAMAKKDWAWVQINFGDYYADYMKHDVTLAYGADGVLAYASRSSQQAPIESERAFARRWRRWSRTSARGARRPRRRSPGRRRPESGRDPPSHRRRRRRALRGFGRHHRPRRPRPRHARGASILLWSPAARSRPWWTSLGATC